MFWISRFLILRPPSSIGMQTISQTILPVRVSENRTCPRRGLDISGKPLRNPAGEPDKSDSGP
jgi:hypothetical protein